MRTLGALLLFCGVALAAPVPPAGPLYFPTKVGTKGVYDDGGREKTQEVTAVTDKDGAKVVTVGRKGPKGDFVLVEKMAVSEKGLFRLETSAAKMDAPFCLLKLPHKPENKWDFRITGPPPLREESGTATAFGPEEVEVPAGKNKAIRVEAEVTIAGGGQRIAPPHRVMFWFAPEVGLIKMVSGNKAEMVLRSFTPGTN